MGRRNKKAAVAGVAGLLTVGAFLVPFTASALADEPAPEAKGDTTQGGALTETGIAVGGMAGKPGRIAGGAAGGAGDGALDAAIGEPEGRTKEGAEAGERLGAGAGGLAGGETGAAVGGQGGYIAGGAVGGALDGAEEGANRPGWWEPRG